MSDPTLWWIVTGIAVGIELLTGTFYLLMIAIGLAAAAIAAHSGVAMPAQLFTAAVVGGAAVLVCYRVRLRKVGAPSVRADRSVNLDIGETVHIDAWNADGTASVKYRGAQWAVVHRPGQSPQPGLHRVTELTGNRLVVEHV
jgi:membrane protein implicated in regulation of membrane protease activity